jgi:hypothetical protein
MRYTPQHQAMVDEAFQSACVAPDTRAVAG